MMPVLIYLPGEFRNAERSTNVEIALVKVNIPKTLQSSLILDNLEHAQKDARLNEEPVAVAHSDFIAAIIEKYRFEVDAGVQLIREYTALQPYIQDSLRKGEMYKNPVLELHLRNDKYDKHGLVNGYIRSIRLKYWEALFQAPEFVSSLTSNLQNELRSHVNELADYEFSESNILSIRAELSKSTVQAIENTILKLFDELSLKHTWDDGVTESKNIHYYDGWKTNTAWKINKKVILPMYGCLDYWSSVRLDYRVKQKLNDIEKCLDFLDAGRTSPTDSTRQLEVAMGHGQTANIKLKHFNVTFYKKGTCHIVFTNLVLLAKLNLFGSQRKGWLPPSYGRLAYWDMDIEERIVVDAYEGKAAYEKVMANRDYYIVEPAGLLVLPVAV